MTRPGLGHQEQDRVLSGIRTLQESLSGSSAIYGAIFLFEMLREISVSTSLRSDSHIFVNVLLNSFATMH